MVKYEYDVALSFAGEDRSIARELALKLTQLHIRVFYDEYEREKLWGVDLAEAFHDIYSKGSRYCVMLVSQNYAQKSWSIHERRSAIERALHEKDMGYILQIKIDDTNLPGIPATIGYIRFQDYDIDGIADLVLRKLGRPTPRQQPLSNKTSHGF